MLDLVLDILHTDQLTTDVETMERGLLMLSQSQRPMPRPMLIPGIHMAMVLGIDTDMEDMDTMVILHTDLTMVGMDMGVVTMDMVDSLPIGHTMVMVDTEDTDIMER